MPICPNCQAKVLQDAVFCEACGWKLDSPLPAGGGEGRPGQVPARGSLRAEIPLLSGAVRQVQARLEGMRERFQRDRGTQGRDRDARRQQSDAKRHGKARTVLGLVAGMALLALWVWLLIRGVRGPAGALDLQLLDYLHIPLSGR